jgi:hypothetical protein
MMWLRKFNKSPLGWILMGGLASEGALVCLLVFRSHVLFPVLGSGLALFLGGCVRIIVDRLRNQVKTNVRH